MDKDVHHKFKQSVSVGCINTTSILLFTFFVLLTTVSPNSVAVTKFYKDISSALAACDIERNKDLPEMQPNFLACSLHPAWPFDPIYQAALLTCSALLRSSGPAGVSWIPVHLAPSTCLAGNTNDVKILELLVFPYAVLGSCAPRHSLNGNDCVQREEGKDEGSTSICSSPEQTGGTNPINLGVGNKYQQEVDYVGGGLFPLTIRRSYNSISGSWRFFSEVVYTPGEATVKVIRPDGTKLPFSSNDSGGWIADPDVTGSLVSIDDGTGNITSWRYATSSDDIEEYGADGRITKIIDRTGLSHSFVYSNTTITVSNDYGGSMLVSLDAQGNIVGFIDTDGAAYTYSYDSEGRLTSVNYPNGTDIRTYHYESIHYRTALTGITDEQGNRLATWSYDILGRAVSSEHANGKDKIIIDYTYLDDLVDPRAIVTNPLGKQTTYHFATVHGVRKVTQVEGHQSTNCAAANQNYTYDANGFKDLVTDWEGNVTDYDHDARGLEVQRTEAKGTPQGRVITTEWHADYRLPVKITEPDRVIDFSYDVQGLLLERKVR